MAGTKNFEVILAWNKSANLRADDWYLAERLEATR